MIAQSAVSLRFPAYTGFAAVLSGAGLPIYIYAPKYYADTYGVSLTVLGAVLGGLRFFDFVQDPVLGWLSERLRAAKAVAVTAGAAMLALSMVGLFAITPPIDPVWWFGLTITGLFTAFSFLTINFYAQGIAKVGDSADGHVRLAAWRESGALMGVWWGFVAATFAASVFMWREWTPSKAHQDPTSINDILSDPLARRLLVLALVNATPVAVSSTLFLFFVESKLDGAGWEGPLLVLFFLAAAISSPVWSEVTSGPSRLFAFCRVRQLVPI